MAELLALTFAGLGAWCLVVWVVLLSLTTIVTRFTKCPNPDARGCTHH